MSKCRVVLFIVFLFSVGALVGLHFFNFQFSEKERVESNTTTRVFDSKFEEGQYYFNQDDNHSDNTYDIQKAKYAYLEAVEKREKDPLLWHQLGRIAFVQGDLQTAIGHFDRQISTYGDSVISTYYARALAYSFLAAESESAQDWKQAENDFLTYLESEPDSPWAHTDLAWVYFQQGKFEEMVSLLEPQVLVTPNHPWLLNMYGLALLNTGRVDESVSVFEKGYDNANKITIEEIGEAYSGNNPASWPEKREEIIRTLSYNLELAKKRAAVTNANE